MKKCEKLLERIKQPIKRSLSDANLKLTDIDQVVMIGVQQNFLLYIKWLLNFLG